MNHRITITAAAAVLLASVSMYPLLQGIGWFWAGAGAIVVAAAAGTATRLPARQAAVVATVLSLGAAAPLVLSRIWYWELLGAAIVIAAAASVTRLRALPAVASLITYYSALLLYLNLVFAGPEAAGWIVPTPNSLHHLRIMAAQGISERIYMPPVPGTHGTDLLAAGGIGLMAVAADLIAVRLRSPAIAGLPLLALFSVPITTSAREGAVGATLTFCVGVIGYLALLAADGRERLRIWGRLVTLWHSGKDDDDDPVRGPDTRALAASGRRIGLAAVSLAIFIPLLLPGLRVHKLFSGHGGAGAGGVGGQVTLTDPIDQMNGMLLHGSNATVLTYRSTSPAPQYQYLQVQILNYNPRTSTWVPQPPSAGSPLGRGGSLPAIPGLSSAVQALSFTTRITISPGVTGYRSPLTFLPLPYAPQDVAVSGHWRTDPANLMVFSAQAGLSGLKYTATSDDVEPTAGQLDKAAAPPASIAAQYLPFPAQARAQLLGLARMITRNARTPFERALALKNWFLADGRFTYSLRSSEPDSTAGLVDFLTRTRSGYCQQFAFAMAALARLVGIPSRIAVGYTAGTKQPNGSWQVTEADAHAWPELYFPGAGWLRFEPTPGGRDGQGTATQPVYATAATTGATGTGPQPNPGSTGGSAPGSRAVSPGLSKVNHLGGLGSATTASRGGSVPVVPIVLAFLVLAGLAPAAVRAATRRRRWRVAGGDAALAHVAWRELHDDLTDYGVGWRASDSPRAVSRRVATTVRLGEHGERALGRIAQAEERARYAKVASAPDTLRADVAAVRRAVAAEASRPVRWRARLLPPSALAPLHAGLQHALDVFGWLDAAGLRIRSRVGELGRES
jgi:hypothetical protein